MKIEFLSGPRKGEIDHAPRGQQTQLLIDVGLIKVIDDTPEPRIPSKDDVIPPMPPAGWELGLWGDERKPAIIRHDGFGGKTVYLGPPVERRWVEVREGDVLGRYVNVSVECPAEVLAKFHALAGNVKEAAAAREKADHEALEAAREATRRSKGGNLAAIARLTYGK